MADVPCLKEVLPIRKGLEVRVAALQHTRERAGIELCEIANYCQHGRVRVGSTVPGQAGASTVNPGRLP